ncbi:MAG TPA: dihydropteroate synthase [Dermatophilaceae bacterium]|nr:dihydropteroate synthase [Dermatophilaceae bacterium]
MGVVNVTPDSFSDGGRWFGTDQAVAHGLRLREQGADLLDVGGESTRPGAVRPTEAEELRRVLPVVRELVAAGAVVSVDTMRAAVAAACVDAGATVVNDVSGGLADPGMPSVVADTGVRYVAMHWRGHSDRMQQHAVYHDVTEQVRAELLARVDALIGDGVKREQLVLDPGFGFAKLPEHNWALLRDLPSLVRDLGLPVLVGTSRKTFLGRLGVPDGCPPRPPAERDAATAATSLLAAQAGVWAVRVHDVTSTIDALAVLAAAS